MLKFINLPSSIIRETQTPPTNLKQPILPVEVNINSIVEEFINESSLKPHQIDVDYILVTDNEGLKSECQKCLSSEVIAIDTETTGLDPHIDKIRLIQISIPENPVLIVDMFFITDIEPLTQLLTNTYIKVFHNAKFDLKMLHMAGITASGNIFDTMIAGQLIDGGLTRGKGSFTLKTLVKKYLDINLPKEEQISDWSGELREEQLIYSAKDAAVLLPLRDKLRELIVKYGLADIARLEFDCIRSVVDMELNGFYLDTEKLIGLQEQLLLEVAEAESYSREFFGSINLNSPKQVLPLLQKSGLQINSTDKKILKTLDSDMASRLVAFKEKKKFHDDNIIRLPEKVNSVTGRIHANFMQAGAATGRFTCSKPNLQQIPRRKEIRGCFQTLAGSKLVIADYSQIELRIAAELSKDETMLKAYAAGEDLHTVTASFITGKSKEEVTKAERQLAKAINFGLIYGAGAETLKEYSKSNYGIDISVSEATDFRNKFFQLYKGIKLWHNKVNSQQSYITYTLGGRFRKFDKTERFKLTDRLNSPDQGTGADILKKALILLKPRIAGLAKLVHIVHDEIILEVSENKAEEVSAILIDCQVKLIHFFM